MDVHEAIEQRREITSFSQQGVETEKIERIVQAGYLAPTGNNLASRELIVITEREQLRSLSEATPFMKWLADAGAGIIVTGRPSVSKYWLQDSSIACGFMWLAATEENLGAAFGAIYHSEDAQESEKRESYIRKLASIPDDRRITAVIGIGYPSNQPKPKKHIPFDEIVYFGKFNE